MALKRENWAEGSQAEVWVPEEDPQIAILRIARELSDWFKKYLGEETSPWLSYESLLNMLRVGYEQSQDEDPEEVYSEEEERHRRVAPTLIWLCCNGADPLAALFWVDMEPHIEKCGESGKWIRQHIMPITYDDGLSRFSFGLDSTWETAAEADEHLWVLRWAFAQSLPSRKNDEIEVLDYNFVVWRDDTIAS